MKNKFSKILLPAVMVLALGFTACSEDDETVVGPASQGAFFPNSSQSAYYVNPGDTEVDLYIMRTDSASAQSVSLNITDESGFFSIPNTIDFPAQVGTIVVPVTFDSNKFDPKDYTVTVDIDSKDAYLYGMTEYTFTIGWENSYRWMSIGEGEYLDSFLFENYYKAEIQRHALDKTKYRIKSIYAEAIEAEGYDTNSANPPAEWINFQILSPGQKIYGVTISTDDLVYFDWFCSGVWLSNYNQVIDVRYPGNFTSLSNESDWTYNCVKSYQENGLPNVVQLAPYYYMNSVGGWNYTQTNGVITIIFPGGRLMDASAEVEVTEVEATEESEVVTVKANVTLGADVTSARVAIIEGNDAESGNFLITHDRADYTTINESGEVTLTMPVSNPSGKYMVIASTYMDKKAVEYGYDSFDYTVPGAQPWTLIATGDYTYNYFWSGVDEGLNLYQSNDDPTLYKIEHWGNDVDFYFTMDNGYRIMVADQFTGYTHSSYGDVYVDDLVDYAESEEDGVSLYVNGTYNFNVIYYVSAGYFGYGYETFTVTSRPDAASAKKAPAHISHKTLKSDVQNISAKDLRFNLPMKAELR